MNQAGTLALWSSGLRYEDVPRPIRAAALAAIADTIANLIAGRRWTRRLSIAAPPLHGAGAGAAADAIAVRRCETDDVFLLAGGHPGSVVVPVALGLGRVGACDGREFVTAIVAGYEVMFAVLHPLFPTAIERGFEATGIGGPFGAAAVAARLLRLGESASASALTIAGRLAGGLQIAGRALAPGLAARAGIQAATLADAGVGLAQEDVDEREALLPRLADHSRGRETLREDLGRRFAIQGNREVKRYPVKASVTSAIEATTRALGQRSDARDVRAILLTMSPFSLRHRSARAASVASLTDAQASVPFSVAVRLARGGNAFDLYADPAVWADPAVAAVASRIRVEPRDDPAVTRRGARATITFTDGQTSTAVFTGSRGGVPTTWTQEALRQRFVAMTASELGEAQAVQSFALIQKLPDDPHALRQLFNLVPARADGGNE